MIRMFLTTAILLTSNVIANAQQASEKVQATPVQKEEIQTATSNIQPPQERIDLSRDPGIPAPAAAPQPNNRLLNPRGQGVAQPFRITQAGTGINNSTQQVNATSNQFNLGNQKATNTIYYDNAGRMTGTNTTIQLGGK